MSLKKLIDTDLLNYFLTKLKALIPTKTSELTNDSSFVVDSNYVHTDNNYSASDKAKLSGIESAINTRFPTTHIADLNSAPYGDICFLETDDSTLNTPYAAGLSSWTMGAVISYCTSASYGTQVYFSRAAREVFIRRLNEGAWSAWIKIPTENDLAPSSVTVMNVNAYDYLLRVNRIGRLVTVSGWIRPKAQAYTAVSTALVKLGTTPATRTFFVGTSDSKPYGMEITTNGNIVFNSSSPTFSNNPYIYFNFSYIVG